MSVTQDFRRDAHRELHSLLSKSQSRKQKHQQKRRRCSLHGGSPFSASRYSWFISQSYNIPAAFCIALPQKRRPKKPNGNDSQKLLDSARGEAGDEAIHAEVVEDGDRHAGDEAAGHEGSPEVYVTVNQKSGHAHAHGEVSRRGDESHSVDELLHHQGEAEDRDREYPGEGDRDNHTKEGPEAAIAVDHGGFFHVLRDGLE